VLDRTSGPDRSVPLVSTTGADTPGRPAGPRVTVWPPDQKEIQMTTLAQGDGALSRAARLVAAARTDLDGTGTRLAAQLAEAEHGWRGAGATAFFAMHAAWDAKHRQVVTVLSDFEQALLATEADALSTDETQSAAYARTQSALV
jgi:WXG100 family type VII secretion target